MSLLAFHNTTVSKITREEASKFIKTISFQSAIVNRYTGFNPFSKKKVCNVKCTDDNWQLQFISKTSGWNASENFEP